MVREWIKKIRTDKKMTKKEVATQAGISESYYDKIERGERNVPVPTAKKLGEVLGVDWEKFFEDNDAAN